MEKVLEQWRPVKDYENYAVSSLGRVKSLNYRHTGREQVMKPYLSGLEGYEYLAVNLYKNGKRKAFGVHQLVALAFSEICGLPFEGAEVNHIDENHFNNVPENLNWLSRKDNINHGTRTERQAKARSKTVYQYTTTTHELVKEWQSATEVHRQMGWSIGNISACCNNHFNREGNNVYKNFIWSYVSP